MDISQAALPYRRSLVPQSEMGALGRLRNHLEARKTRPGRVDVEKIAQFNQPKNEFYPLNKSPHSYLREMSANMVQYSSCPTCLSINDRLPEEEWNDIESIPGGT